jgi:hypothetical protein
MTRPITPPPELVRQWTTSFDCPEAWGPKDQWIASKAAQWGADQELKACCHYFARDLRESLALELRAARRPKPPSLKEQALESLHHLEAGCLPNIDLLRRALETLPE